MATVLLTTGLELSSPTIIHCGARERAIAHLSATRLDRALAAGLCPDSSTLASLRARTLIGISTRRTLAQGLRHLVTAARTPVLTMTPVPLCRRKIVDAEEMLGHLAERLSAAGPVDVRGVAQIRLLLHDGRSPVYGDPLADDLRPALHAATEALEVSV
jgi:hypothetical protein